MVKSRKVSNVYESNDYSGFIPHPINRNVDTNGKGFKTLVKSMAKYGFPATEAIHVIKGENGSLIIKKGHHRFAAAKQLGLPIKFSIEERDIPIHDLESPGVGKWKPRHYFESYVKQGSPAYLEVQEYMEKTGISRCNAMSMFCGFTAGSGGYDEGSHIQKGTYTIKDRDHPNLVGDLVVQLKLAGIEWASENLPVRALSRIVRVPDFDAKRLVKKAKAHKSIFEKEKTLDGYLKMFEKAYNYKVSQAPKIPLAFLASEIVSKRSISYGITIK